MPDRASRGRRRLAVGAAVIAAVGVLVVLAALLDIWPFSGSGTLTRAEFIAKGDAICKSAHQQFAQLQPSPPNTAEEAAVLTGKLLTISQDEYNRIRALDAPPELESAVVAYLKARADGIALIRDAYTAAEADDPHAYYRDLLKVSRTQVRRLQLAKAAGFSECSKPVAALGAATH